MVDRAFDILSQAAAETIGHNGGYSMDCSLEYFQR